MDGIGFYNCLAVSLFSAEVDDGEGGLDCPLSALNRPFSSALHNSSYIGDWGG